MAEFYVDTDKLESNATDIERFKAALDAIESEIFSVRNNISFASESAARVKERIKKLAEQVGDEAKATGILSDKLLDIVSMYRRYEKNIIDNISASVGEQNTDSSQNPDPEDTNDDSNDMSLEEAIDFLNGLSMSTSIDGAVLAVIEYMIKLYDSAIDTGILGTLGNAAGLVGLITGVAADILYALDNGSSINALLADLIVDVGLWGVGLGVTELGKVIGTAVGGPVGTVVGNFVGGLVGNGVSIAMNVDWNGDAEGGVGKDALSDWIDNQLDKLWNDKEFEAAI